MREKEIGMEREREGAGGEEKKIEWGREDEWESANDIV